MELTKQQGLSANHMVSYPKVANHLTIFYASFLYKKQQSGLLLIFIFFKKCTCREYVGTLCLSKKLMCIFIC